MHVEPVAIAGVAGMPFVLLAICSMIVSRKSKSADHQDTRNERSDQPLSLAAQLYTEQQLLGVTEGI